MENENKEKFICFNGEFLSVNEPNINVNNRGFHFGDTCFETIRAINGKTWCLDVHLARLYEGMRMVKMIKPVYFAYGYFEKLINELLGKNGFDKGARVRLTVVRKSGGAYTPISNEVDFVLESYPISDNDFTINEEGVSVELYPEMKKKVDKLSPYKLGNSMLYVMGAIWAKENNLDDALLQNYKLGIIESTNSNLFIVSNGVLYTPAIEDGCLGGTMRMHIINLALEYKIKVYECNITPSNLLVADEIFLTNAIQGIKWVSSYKNKRYFNNTAKKLVEYLNLKVEKANLA